MKKRVFLLEQAKDFALEKNQVLTYDYSQHLNFTTEEGWPVPAALIEAVGPTHSKTMRWPSDDDPDDELCY